MTDALPRKHYADNATPESMPASFRGQPRTVAPSVALIAATVQLWDGDRLVAERNASELSGASSGTISFAQDFGLTANEFARLDQPHIKIVWPEPSRERTSEVWLHRSNLLDESER